MARRRRTQAYRSRGGLTTVGNLLTPTLGFHGSDDARVPVLHARLWVGAAHGAGRGALVTYHEQAGVGDHRHNGNETKAQLAFRNRTSDDFLRAHRTPPLLPERGSFIVAGYVKTARFEVMLDSVDRVGRVEYDLPAGRLDVFAPNATATVRLRQPDRTWTQSEVACRRYRRGPPTRSASRSHDDANLPLWPWSRVVVGWALACAVATAGEVASAPEPPPSRAPARRRSWSWFTVPPVAAGSSTGRHAARSPGWKSTDPP